MPTSSIVVDKSHAMRKNSVSAQLSRTARRFSTVIAPQFTKIEPIPQLQRYKALHIRVNDIRKIQSALSEYVLHNAVQFDPIEFDIYNHDRCKVLSANLYAEELVLMDGSKRLVSIVMSESESDFNGLLTAKIRHPISGMKVYEISENSPEQSWTVMNTVEDSMKCRMEAASSLWTRVGSACGCLFVPEWWRVVNKESAQCAELKPRKIKRQNAIKIEWDEKADIEQRMLILCFGLVQTIREAHPDLMHVLQQFRVRRQNR
uniref:CDT1 domain-containing protein n=1 Tax=Steinernema glaseri TaxID=37863 RepID=A0A1I8A0R4_9BILA